MSFLKIMMPSKKASLLIRKCENLPTFEDYLFSFSAKKNSYLTHGRESTQVFRKSRTQNFDHLLAYQKVNITIYMRVPENLACFQFFFQLEFNCLSVHNNYASFVCMDLVYLVTLYGHFVQLQLVLALRLVNILLLFAVC